MSDKEESTYISSPYYKRLRPDGTVNSKRTSQADYDQVTQYIKDVFPKATRVQKEIEQTLKRTFILGRTKKSKSKQLNTSKSSFNSQAPSAINRKLRLKLQKQIPKNLKYEDFIPLNSLWKGYISDMLKNEKRVAEIQTRMCRADFHGALISVHFSNCKDYIGVKGIVLRETKNTFIVVTSSNVTKTIPKIENVFNVDLENPKGTVQVAGNSFGTRPAERANKKIKGIMDFISIKAYKSQVKNSRL